MSCAPLTILEAQVGHKEKMNVLFIAVDDMNDWVGCFGGNPQVKTPNMDRFAGNNAMIMMNAQCPSSLSCPSRSAFLTGLSPPQPAFIRTHKTSGIPRQPWVYRHCLSIFPRTDTFLCPPERSFTNTRSMVNRMQDSGHSTCGREKRADFRSTSQKSL